MITLVVWSFVLALIPLTFGTFSTLSVAIEHRWMAPQEAGHGVSGLGGPFTA
jgi:hypothetical protein